MSRGTQGECRPVCCRTKQLEPAGHGHQPFQRESLCRPWSIRPTHGNRSPACLEHPTYYRAQPGQNSRRERGWMRPSMCAIPRPEDHVMVVPCAGTRSCSASSPGRWWGRSQIRMSGRGETSSVPGEPNKRHDPIFRKKPDLVDQHPTSPNRTQPVSGCQRLGSCEPTRSTGISARHVESAMILAGSQRSA